ncbi:MAG: hypothetical protein Q8Q87_01655 [Candidatus Omnitrophota bacterium]|nr:hypothetical protein [Candidatus Omnitrophota bacterium]
MTGILEAIKKGFGVAAKNLGLVLILIVFNMIGSLVSMPFAIQPGQTPTPQVTASALIFSVVFILISIFFQGASLGLIRDYVKGGIAKLGSFASYGIKYYLRLLSLGLLIILIIGIVALVAGLIVAATTPLNNAIVTNIAIAVAVAIVAVVGLLYFIPLTLSPYALVCGELGVIAAMKSSLATAKKPFSRVLLLVLLFVLLILIALGIGLVIGFLVGLLTAVMPAAAGRIAMAIVTSIINGYLGVMMTGSFMVFYLGLKEKTV